MAAIIEKIWYSNHFTKWLLFPISLLLFLVTKLKRFLYINNLLKSKSSKVPVLVVGNITVGGTGKTPLITFLVQQLTQRNLKVGIVSRGYLSTVEVTPHLVSQEDSVELIGDEAFMQYQKLQVPMAIGAQRSESVALLTNTFDLDLIISDDGLQHYQMQRFAEILVVDGTREFGNGLCLPFGPLREDKSRLKTVNYIVQNSGEKVLDSIKQKSNNCFHMQMIIEGLVHIQSGEIIPLTNIKDKSIDAVCAIGNPNRFFDSLKKYNSNINTVIFSDHYAYKAHDFENLKGDMLIMTEKDAVKCKSFCKEHWYFLKVSPAFKNGNDSILIESIIQQIKFYNNEQRNG